MIKSWSCPGLVPALVMGLLSFGVRAQEARTERAPAKPDDIEFQTVFDFSGPAWKLQAKTFLDRKTKTLFRWLAQDKMEAARYPGYANSPPLCFGPHYILEANIRFKDEKELETVELSFYNRADAGEIKDEKKFLLMLEALDKTFSDWAGGAGTELKARSFAGSKMKIYQKAWVKAPTAVVLSWSSSGKKKDFNAEYLKAEFTRFDPNNDPRKWNKSTILEKAPDKAKGNLAENLKRDPDGTVLIDNIPMTDQGAKGYCAVATAERIFRYYGLDFDQHVFAQLAESSAQMGTNTEEMFKVLKKISGQCGVRVRSQYKIHKDLDGFLKNIEKYNKFAKKKKISPVNLSSCVVEQDKMQIYDISGIYRQLDPEGYREFRVQTDKNDYKNFKKDISLNIDKGIPLAWSVMLGILPEKAAPLQMGGGHMRLIIGYNLKKNELLYSDSWGAGHELKTMPFDDAWTMTIGLDTFEPRK